MVLWDEGVPGRFSRVEGRLKHSAEAYEDVLGGSYMRKVHEHAQKWQLYADIT